jgi:hypothetical protein
MASLTAASACLYRFFRAVEHRQTTVWNGPHLRPALSYNSGFPNETGGFLFEVEGNSRLDVRSARQTPGYLAAV